MAKANQIDALQEITKELQKGSERKDIVAKYCKKLQKSPRTIDTLIQKASQKLQQDQQQAEEIRVRETAEATANALKEGLKSDLELEVFLCQIAMGDLQIEEVVKGETVIRDTSPMERIQAIKTLYTKRGSNAPVKSEVTGKGGEPLIPKPDFSKLTDAELRALASIRSKAGIS